MFATVRAKLIGFCTLLMLLLLLMGGAGYFGYSELNSVIGSLRDGYDPAKSSAQNGKSQDLIRMDILQILRSTRNGDIENYRVLEKDLKRHLDMLISNTANNNVSSTEAKQALASARAVAEGYAKLAQSISSLSQTDINAADAQFSVFEAEYRNLDTKLAAARNLIAAEISEAHKNTDISIQRIRDVTIAVGAATLVLFLLLAFFLYHGIMSPLNQLLEAIGKIDGGAYDVRIKLRTKDELGSVGRAFDKLLDERIASLKATAADNERLNNSVIGLFSAMGALAQKDLTVRAPVTDDIIGTLGDAINQLTDVTATVLHHVTKVAGVVEAASERMKQQSDVVNEMAKEEDVIVVRLISNLETAMASIGEVAIFARDSNRAAAEATKSTESAMETVQATLVGMNAIRETISEMEKRIKRLGERSQEISQIVNLINTISERTHVLSLNAAMQAAMAGEAGRGFAVVAEEVQRLAENSRQATGQIANLVQNIQVETNDTIATVNKTIEQVVNESELAHNAGERMRETHEATARLVRLVATIATSSAEQTKIAAVLRTAADEIAQFTEKTAEQLVAQNQSAASLVSASQKLVDAISVFKLPSAEPENEDNASVGEETQLFAQFK